MWLDDVTYDAIGKELQEAYDELPSQFMENFCWDYGVLAAMSSHVETGEALPALRRRLGLVPFGEAVKFTVERAGKTMEFTAKAAEKGIVEGDELSLNGWGFTAKVINRFDNPNLFFYRNHGVFVYGVTEHGGAARGGLHKQDIIVSVNGRMIDTLADLSEAYELAEKNSAESRRSVMVVMRSGATVRLTVNYSVQ